MLKARWAWWDSNGLPEDWKMKLVGQKTKLAQMLLVDWTLKLAGWMCPRPTENNQHM